MKSHEIPMKSPWNPHSIPIIFHGRQLHCQDVSVPRWATASWTPFQPSSVRGSPVCGWKWGIPPSMAILDGENHETPWFLWWFLWMRVKVVPVVFIPCWFGPLLVSRFLTKGPTSTVEVDCRFWSSIVCHILLGVSSHFPLDLHT